MLGQSLGGAVRDICFLTAHWAFAIRYFYSAIKIKGLNDRTARLTVRQEKNFKILKNVVFGLCIAVPIPFYVMLMIGKQKIAEHRRSNLVNHTTTPIDPHFAANYTTMYWLC